MATIHPSAVVHPQARLAENVTIGSYAYIGPNVEIGDNCEIGPHAYIDGWTTIGTGNRIYPFCIIGTDPQDLKYHGEQSYVRIGNNNLLREFVSIHRANAAGESTIIGNENMLMAYVHVGHNCVLGNNIIIANAVGLSGHVEIEDMANIGGMAGIHQFAHVGRMSMVGGYSKITRDVPPFSKVDGQPAMLYGLNVIGLRRKGISSENRAMLKRAFRLIYEMPLTKAVEEMKAFENPTAELQHLIHFLTNHSRLGVITRVGRRNAADEGGKG